VFYYEVLLIAKQFKYYADRSVTLSPCGLRSIMRVAQYTQHLNYKASCLT